MRNSSILTNARLVLPSGMLERGYVSVAEGSIQKIGEGDPPSANEALDLGGATLFPGFLDLHIHGAAGVDTMVATSGALGDVSMFLAGNGVTGWLPTLVPASSAEYDRAIASIDETIAAQANAALKQARVLGVHYEGPFVNEAQCGALHREHFRTFTQPSDVDLPKPNNPVAKLLMTLAPEVGGGIELIEELRRQGWIVSIGHTRASIDVLDAALSAGARHMTHFMNAMAPLHHRKPGPVAWGLMHDEVTCDFIADGIHLDSFMLRLLVKLKDARRLCLISDAIAATGQGDGEYDIWGETISVTNGRTSNAQGSIAGSVITMADAVRMMRSVGASDMEIAQMASTNPARLLGLDSDCGTVEEGKRADLVALDNAGNVRLTMIGGQVAFLQSVRET